MTKVVLLDRDGVINQDSMHYIKSEKDFIPIAGSLEALAKLTQAGVRIGIATNQSGVARGLYSETALMAIHNKLQRLASSYGAKIEAIEYCLHLPETGCDCRKPAPGMLLSLAKSMGLATLEGVPFVGDRVSDIQAAQAVNADPYIVLSPMTDLAALQSYASVPVFSSLALWVDNWLCAQA